MYVYKEPFQKPWSKPIKIIPRSDPKTVSGVQSGRPKFWVHLPLVRSQKLVLVHFFPDFASQPPTWATGGPQVVLHGDDVPKLPGSANMLSPRSSVAKKKHLALLAFVCFTWACLHTTYIVLSETLVSDFFGNIFFSRFLCFQLRPRIDRVARGCLEGYHHLSGLPDSELNQGYFRFLFRELMIFQASQTTYPKSFGGLEMSDPCHSVVSWWLTLVGCYSTPMFK